MQDIGISELIRKKLETEQEIMKIIQDPIVKFQKETGIGIKYIDVEMVCSSQCDGSPVYVVSNVAIKLDLDFIEVMDTINKIDYIDKEGSK